MSDETTNPYSGMSLEELAQVIRQMDDEEGGGGLPDWFEERFPKPVGLADETGARLGMGWNRLEQVLNKWGHDLGIYDEEEYAQLHSLNEQQMMEFAAQTDRALQDRVRSISEAEDFGEGFSRFVKDKEGNLDIGGAGRVAAAVTAESLPISLPMLGAGAATLATGGAAAAPLAALLAGVTSASTEYAATMAEAISEQGLDPSKPEDIKKFLANDTWMEQAREKGILRGVGIGAFDAASFGLAGRLYSPTSNVVKRLGNRSVASGAGASAEIGAQAAAGAAGEALAQRLTGESRPGDVLLEAAGELGPGAAEIAIQGTLGRRERGQEREPEDQATQEARRMVEALGAAQSARGAAQLAQEGQLATSDPVAPGSQMALPAPSPTLTQTEQALAGMRPRDEAVRTTKVPSATPEEIEGLTIPVAQLSLAGFTPNQQAKLRKLRADRKVKAGTPVTFEEASEAIGQEPARKKFTKELFQRQETEALARDVSPQEVEQAARAMRQPMQDEEGPTRPWDIAKLKEQFSEQGKFEPLIKRLLMRNEIEDRSGLVMQAIERGDPLPKDLLNDVNLRLTRDRKTLPEGTRRSFQVRPVPTEIKGTQGRQGRYAFQLGDARPTTVYPTKQAAQKAGRAAAARRGMDVKPRVFPVREDLAVVEQAFDDADTMVGEVVRGIMPSNPDVRRRYAAQPEVFDNLQDVQQSITNTERDQFKREKFAEVYNPIRDELHKIAKKVAPGVAGVKIQNVIKQGDTIAEGAYDPVKNIILLSAGVYEPSMTQAQMKEKLKQVMNHELIHHLRQMGLFTDAEWKALTDAAARRKSPTYGVTYTKLAELNGYPADQVAEEAVAEMYREWTDTPSNVQGKPATVFGRILKFFQRLFGAMDKQEAQGNPIQDIISAIRTGEVGRREVQDILKRTADRVAPKPKAEPTPEPQKKKLSKKARAVVPNQMVAAPDGLSFYQLFDPDINPDAEVYEGLTEHDMGEMIAEHVEDDAAWARHSKRLIMSPAEAQARRQWLLDWQWNNAPDSVKNTDRPRPADPYEQDRLLLSAHGMDARVAQTVRKVAGRVDPHTAREIAAERIGDWSQRIWGKTRSQEAWHKAFTRNMVNRFQGFFDLSKLTAELKSDDPQAGLRALGNENAFMFVEIAQQLPGRMMALIEHGMIKYDPATKALDLVEGTKSLFDILKPISEHEKRHFQTYSVAQNEIRYRSKYGKEGFVGLTEDEMQHVIRTAPAHFYTVWQEFQTFNEGMLDFAEATGILSPDKRLEFSELAYVPYYRALDQDAETHPGSSIGPRTTNVLNNPKSALQQKRKGSEDIIGDLHENVAKNIESILRAGLKNVALQMTASHIDTVEQAVNEGRTDAANYFGRRLTNQEAKAAKMDKERAVMSFRDQGEFVHYEVADPALWAGMSAMAPRNQHAAVEAMAKIANILRAGITLTPGFMLANLWRGKLAAYVNADAPLNPALTAQGFVEAYNNTHDALKLRVLSGIGGYRYGMGEKNFGKKFRKMLRQEHKDTDMPRRVIDRLTGVIDALERIGEASELAERVALMKKLQNQRDANGNRVWTDMQAAYEGSNLINFNRKGAGAGVVGATFAALIPMVPFLNARIQGLYRLLENQQAKREFGLKVGNFNVAIPVDMWLRGALLTSISAGLYLMNNVDDERWDDETLERKIGYDIIYAGDTTLYFPRAFEIGSFFSSMPILMADAIRKGEGDDAATGFASILLNTFAFNVIPQGLKPAIETMTDFNFYTFSSIEGTYYSGLEPGDRVRGNTSATAAWIGKQFNLSPIMIDHLVRGYGGGLAMGGFALIDGMAGTTGLIPERAGGFFGDPVNLASPGGWARAADFARFVKMDHERASQYVRDFYDLKIEAQQAHNTIKAAQDRGDLARVKRLREDRKDVLRIKRGLDRIGRAISKLNSQIRSVEMNVNMSTEEKTRRLSMLRRRKNELAARGAKLGST